MSAKDVVQRAYEMARSGAFVGTSDIARALSGEGYWDFRSHLDSRTLKLELKRLCRGAKRQRAETAPRRHAADL
jgi:hypothetical protein